MAVSIRPSFNKGDIEKMLTERVAAIEKVILMRLQKVGETFVKNAREGGQYKDQTGNLRNSIGYVILRNGEQLYDNFRKSARVKTTIARGKNKGKDKITSGSDEGVNMAKKVVEKVKARYPRGYVLIVVAGMDYAAAVESKGIDVLTASSLQAETDLKQAIVAFNSKITKR